uniref:Immunoglobulin V-set domain-containing protein n=1 Tax=Amphilophus citrinellus TaxID=61819 RepID=A0A3Q0S1D9_AMPCI
SNAEIYVNHFPCLAFLSASLQLQCDKREITAHIGGEFILKCNYDTNSFRYSKKYWCRGNSRSTCESLAHSENVQNTHKSQVIDLVRRGLFVKVTNLQFGDAGMYWVGIDKIYSDIMTPAHLRYKMFATLCLTSPLSVCSSLSCPLCSFPVSASFSVSVFPSSLLLLLFSTMLLSVFWFLSVTLRKCHRQFQFD